MDNKINFKTNKMKVGYWPISLIFFLSIYIETVAQEQVRNINWEQFNKHVKSDSISLMVKKSLLNVNKFALSEWYHNIKRYNVDSTGYLDLRSKADNNERRYRLPSGMAFALAISIKTGVYDKKVTQIENIEARKIAVRLLSSVAFDHKVNSGRKVWGSDWQAAHWAYYCGYASWLLWDQITDRDRKNILNMMVFEADRLLTEPPLFYKDPSRKNLFPGDSKIEEDAWNAELLYLTSVMMPNQKHSKAWYNQALTYMIAATAMPSDLNNDKVLHGKPVKSWLKGYNVEEPGIVINHDIIHPLYNALSSVVNAPIVFSLVDRATPEAARFNIRKIYSSLINTRFKSPPYESPGGTMYRPGKAEVYYPQGSDWGTEIYDSYANIDVAAWMYSYDRGEKFSAAYWAKLHINAVLNQQRRFEDGHTYLNEKENSYYGKEAAIATRIGSAWMSIWMQAQRPATYTNK